MGQAGVFQVLSAGPSCKGTPRDHSQFLSRAVLCGCAGNTLSKEFQALKSSPSTAHKAMYPGAEGHCLEEEAHFSWHGGAVCFPSCMVTGQRPL